MTSSAAFAVVGVIGTRPLRLLLLLLLLLSVAALRPLAQQRRTNERTSNSSSSSSSSSATAEASDQSCRKIRAADGKKKVYQRHAYHAGLCYDLNALHGTRAVLVCTGLVCMYVRMQAH
jgi:hypothetical protein